MGKFLVGLVLGIVIAGGLAFYLNNLPNQFVNKVQPGGINNNYTESSPMVLAPSTKLQEISDNNESPISKNKDASSPDYDFYDILPGLKKADASKSDKQASVTKYYVQVGSFNDSNLANDMKARLTLMGFDVKIKSQQDNGKIINKVILGPYRSQDKAESIIKALDDNDIQGTLVKISD